MKLKLIIWFQTWLAKTSAMRMAVWFGLMTEIVLCALFVAFGSFGPCGSSNDFSGFVLMFHLPGILLAQQLTPDSGILFIPLALASGAVTFTILFWITISLWRQFRRKNSTTDIDNFSQKS